MCRPFSTKVRLPRGSATRGSSISRQPCGSMTPLASGGKSPAAPGSVAHVQFVEVVTDGPGAVALLVVDQAHVQVTPAVLGRDAEAALGDPASVLVQRPVDG